jgi:hypothetical protein
MGIPLINIGPILDKVKFEEKTLLTLSAKALPFFNFKNTLCSLDSADLTTPIDSNLNNLGLH